MASFNPTPEGTPRIVYYHDGTNWRVALVDTDGHVQIDVLSNALPTGAATEATLADIKTAAQLIDDLRNALAAVATDQLRTDIISAPTLEIQSPTGDKVWSFDGIVEEALSDLSLPAGYSAHLGTSVPAGKIHNITIISTMMEGTVPSNIQIAVSGLGGGVAVVYQKSPVSGVWYAATTNLFLQEGDRMAAYIYGATAGDDLYFRYAGVQMDTP